MEHLTTLDSAFSEEGGEMGWRVCVGVCVREI